MRDACQAHSDLQASTKARIVLNIKNCLHKIARSLNYAASESEKQNF